MKLSQIMHQVRGLSYDKKDISNHYCPIKIRINHFAF